MHRENHVVMMPRFAGDFDTQQLGAPSGYTWRIAMARSFLYSDGNFRCRADPAWTAEALLSALARDLAGNAGSGLILRRCTTIAEETERASSLLNGRFLTTGPPSGDPGG